MTGQPTIITPTPKQCEAKILADNNTITLYGGAVRGGKTYWGILYLWSLMIKYAKSRWVILRESQGNLEQNTLVSFNKLLYEGLWVDVDKSKSTKTLITMKNGSQLIFMAESYEKDKEHNRFRGLEINGGLCEEINEIQESTFYKMIERSGSWQGSPGCPIKIIGTCNPTKGWVKDKFHDPWKTNTLPKGWAYIPANIFDNPHISAEYKESLKLLPAFDYEVFVNGNWDIERKTGGEFYKYFDEDKHVKEGINYNPDLAIHMSLDFNVNPYMTCTLYQVEGRQIYAFDEICLKNPHNTTRGICKEFIRRYPAHKAGLFIYGDTNGKNEDTRSEKGFNDYRIAQNELSQYSPNLRVPSKNPYVVTRGNFINSIFYNNFDKIDILVNINCKIFITDLRNTKEAEDGTKFKEKARDSETGVSYEKYGHASDSFDYFICEAFKESYNLYQKGNEATRPILAKRNRKVDY